MSSYCLERNQMTKLAGTQSNNEYQYISIKVQQCQNATTASPVAGGPKCKSQSDINSFFNSH